jgi:mycothiol synthase
MTDLALDRHEQLDAATEAAVQRLVERAAVHDRHSPVGEHTWVKVVEGDPDAFAIVARSAGEVTGYAQVTRHPAHGSQPARLVTELLVDPAHRGRGIGSALLERVTAEGRAWGARRVDAWAHHADAAAIGLAEAHGMRLGRQLWQMSLDLAAAPPERRRVRAPQGVDLATYRPGDDDVALIGLVRSAFPDHPENGAFDESDLVTRQRMTWYDPGAVLLARDSSTGEPLGIHWGKLDDPGDRAEVHLLGIAPAAQGSGLGRWLLLEGLEWMRRRGARLAYLYVEADNEPAVALYRQAGFRHEHLDTCYELDVTSSPAECAGVRPRDAP